LMHYLDKLVSQWFDAWMIILARDNQLFEIRGQLQIATEWLRDNIPRSHGLTLWSATAGPLRFTGPHLTNTSAVERFNPSNPRGLLTTLTVLITRVRKVLSPAPDIVADIPASGIIKPNIFNRFLTRFRVMNGHHQDIIVFIMDTSQSFLKQMNVTGALPHNPSVSRGEIGGKKFVQFTLASPEQSRNIVFLDFNHYAERPEKLRPTDNIQAHAIKWLDKSYPRKYKVAGILYLHPVVNGVRPPGIHLTTLEVGFGDWKVLLATTFWHLVDPAKGSRQQEEFRTRFWRPMIERGSDIIRLDYTVPSALRAVDHLLDGSGNVGTRDPTA